MVVNLNTALANPARNMQKVASQAATLQVTTGVVDDLKNFDPGNADKRFVTRIRADGDSEVFVPSQMELLEAGGGGVSTIAGPFSQQLEFLKGHKLEHKPNKKVTMDLVQALRQDGEELASQLSDASALMVKTSFTKIGGYTPLEVKGRGALLIGSGRFGMSTFE